MTTLTVHIPDDLAAQLNGVTETELESHALTAIRRLAEKTRRTSSGPAFPPPGFASHVVVRHNMGEQTALSTEEFVRERREEWRKRDEKLAALARGENIEQPS